MDLDFQRHLDVQLQAERLIGVSAWSLVRSFGKLMDGPRAGLYVSGIAFDEQLAVVRRLACGETVHVHLMHKHKSGNQASALRLSSSGLVMVFDDHEELA